MKRAIVTGANGFIGSSLIVKLIENEIDVLAIDLSFSSSKLPQSKHITTLEMSIDNISDIETMVEKGDYEAFYHLAWSGVNGPNKGNIDVQIHNIELAIKCATTAKNIECKKFLCAGTIAEQIVKSIPLLKVTNSGMMYGVAKECTHLLLEAYCKSISLNLIWMQFSNIYGPNNMTGNLISYTINELINNRYASFGPSEQPYDFIFADDLIDAVYRIGHLETNNNFYYIGSGQPKLLKEYLAIVGKLYGNPELIQIGARQDDGIKYYYSMFDNSALVLDIGNYVTMSFEEGIQLTLKAFVSKSIKPTENQE